MERSTRAISALTAGTKTRYTEIKILKASRYFSGAKAGTAENFLN